MGQYHAIFNLDKKERLTPRAFGDGAKLCEWWGSYSSRGLVLLLAATNGQLGRGGGDWRPWVDGISKWITAETYGAERMVDFDVDAAKDIAAAVPGRWAGDRIAVVGDYMESGDLPEFDGDPYRDESYLDISDVVLVALYLDHYTGLEFRLEGGRGLDSALACFGRTLKSMQAEA